MRRVLGLIALLALAGCGSHPPVAVVDGNPAVVVEGGRGAPAQAREGYYLVKKGDNLYRIALAHGATTHDLVTWNSLTDDTRIEIGQELRVTPPEGVVEIKPIEAPAPIVTVGDNGAPASSSPGVAGNGSAGVIREPKGGKVAYSDTALAQVRAMDGGAPPPRPAEQPAAAPTPAPAPAPAPTPAATDTVDWTWPVAGKVIRGFGKNNGGEISRGIDIAGRKGEPIQAAAGGKVSFVGSLDKYGDFVVVRHDGDYLSVYAHTSKILVKRDQTVTKGQKIAEVGSSGTDQPKLHFEIRHKSEPVDPVKLLPSRQ
jgi:lipoprotein NlpD